MKRSNKGIDTQILRTQSVPAIKSRPNEQDVTDFNEANIPQYATLLFEVSTEVAAKSGGIYTVIRSKAAQTVSLWKDRYCLIGLYQPKAAREEFEAFDPPFEFVATIEELERQGIHCHYGRWLIPGYPRCLLLEIDNQGDNVDGWKGQLYNFYDLPTPAGLDDTELNNYIAFGFLVYKFFFEFCARHIDWPIVAHFHEWCSAVGLLLIREPECPLPVATVFTTHATLLGRYLCAGQCDFYNSLPSVDSDAEAMKRGIFSRHRIEHVAVHRCHVFTTVSAITGDEAKHIHKRAPNGILPNGLNIDRRTLEHEHQNQHEECHNMILEFIRGHFYGHLTSINLDKTVILFSAGRYEHYNKGFDMFIEALARLNARLKKNPKNEITVVAFIVTKAKTTGHNVDTLRGGSLLRMVRQQVDEIQHLVGERLVQRIMEGKLPDFASLISHEETMQLKRLQLRVQRSDGELPPITSHNLTCDTTDPILIQLRQCSLFNRTDDPVKVIYHPAFLSSVAPVLPMEYMDFVRGCNLGVFPSYYEPWGYTPAECMAVGVASVSSNLAGFGNFIESEIHDHDSKGAYVIDRRFKSPEESMEQLVDVMHDYVLKPRAARTELRKHTLSASALIDWSVLGSYYEDARDHALEMIECEVEH